jgi:hypothetical protein
MKGDVQRAVWDALPQAYVEASDNDRLPAPARQVMYAARRISGLGDQLSSRYFLDHLIGDRFDRYVAKNPEAANWDIVRDGRGSFHEPHTRKEVSLGTIAVRDYLRQVRNARSVEERVDDNERPPELLLGWWTIGPRDRFAGIVYVEKEGFDLQIADAQIAERYDLAFLSCKGMSVHAARNLLRELHDHYEVPVFVVRDFDKAGFSIFDTLGDGDYEDLGLRLSDLDALAAQPDWDLDLAAESVTYGDSDPRPNMVLRGASPEEIAFLCPSTEPPFRGRRVELNALVGRRFTRWLEAKLSGQVAKVVPDEDTLERVYRWAYARRWLNVEIARLYDEAQDEAADAELPDDLGGLLANRLEEDPHLNWDSIVAHLVSDALPDDEVTS